MSKNTVSVAPAPALVRKALEHCQIPLTYNDDCTVTIPNDGVGWTANGEMVIPADSTLHRVLTALITTAMLKHLTDTMVLPSNAARVRGVAEWIEAMANEWVIDDEAGLDALNDALEQAEMLRTVAMHLDEQGAA